MTTADKIRYYRQQAGLSQTELGNLLGVKKNAVSKWECGRVDDIPASQILGMANIFGISPTELINMEEEPNPVIKMYARVAEHDLARATLKLTGLNTEGDKTRLALADKINDISDDQAADLLKMSYIMFK